MESQPQKQHKQGDQQQVQVGTYVAPTKEPVVNTHTEVPSSPTDAAKEVGQFAKLIGDYGVMICLCAVVLMAFAGSVWIGLKYWWKRIGGEYIKITDIKSYLKEHEPHVIKLKCDELPKLSGHALFTTCTTGIRSAESLTINDIDVVDQVKTDLARDLLTWSFRAYRNVFSGLIEAIYDHKGGFEAAIGDRQKLRAIISDHISIVNGAIRSKLVGELNFPVAVYDAWYNTQREQDRVLADVIELVILQNEDGYWQLNNVLTALYAKVLVLESEVIKYINKVQVENIKYVSGNAAKDATYMNMNSRALGSYNPNHSATLESGWKPKL